MEENQVVEMKETPKAKGFGKGVGMGIVLGMVLTAAFLGIGVLIYTKVTGDYLIFGKHGVVAEDKCNVLDAATVKKVNELSTYMDLYYYEDFEDQDIREGMISGVMTGLEDPYSVYYTKEDYQDLKISTSGSYYGIGAALQQDKETMVVHISKVYDGTPSAEAGLKKDDEILYVDGIEATSMELTKLVQKIRGNEGTTVRLKIYRESEKKELEFEVTRKNVVLPSVEGELLEDGIGYVQISEFQNSTATQFHDIITELEKKGMKGLVVDVRSNPGGLLDVVVDILDELLPKGILVYTKDKYDNRENYKSDANCVDYPIVVLADESSASASEIFAGAIKDYGYGTIVGTKTFGKGIVQSIFPLEDGDALKITTAKYFTPKGNYIHGVGIEPDVEVKFEYTGPKDGEYDKKYDNQLQKAIEIMKEKLEL